MSNSKNKNDVFNKKYLKNKFVDLPELFKVIRTMSRGELFKELPYVVKLYNDNWDETMDKNTYADVRRFVALLKVYNVKHNIPKIDKYERNRKFVAHMFSSISKTTTLPSRVETTIGKVDDLVEKMHNIVDASSNDIKSMFANLNAFTSMFVPSTSDWTEIVSYVVKFAAFGYLLSHEHNRSVSNVIALLTLILPTGVGDCIISSLKRAIQGIWVKFKNNDDLVAQSYDDDNTIVAFFKVTVHLMQSMFRNVPLEHFKDMQLSVSKIKMVADYLKNTNTIFEYIMKLFQKTLEIVGNKLLKYYGKLPKILQQENLNDLIDRYVEIKQNKLDVKANTNSYIARQVISVYNDALTAQAKLVKVNKKIDFTQSKLLAYLNIMIRNLEPIISKIPDHVKGTKNARRTKPFWLYIYGEPRIGKTSMFQPYVVNAVAHCAKLIDKYQDYSEYTYFRNCGDEYWEKYCGQPVLWYNDLFQVFTNEQKVNIGIEELTNVVDDNLYPLNMAFEEKHNVYFDSEFVVSNAQDDIVGKNFVSNKCLSKGEHIYSRRNMVVRLRVSSEYKSSVGLNYHAIEQARDAKVPFVGDLFPTNMYLVDFMDPVTGAYIKTVHFTDAIKIIVHGFNAYRNVQNQFKDKLFKHFEQMWAQSNDTWEDALNQASLNEWNCELCKQVYDESSMLDQSDRNDIRTVLLLNCPHKEIRVKNKWQEFGEVVKLNVVALWDYVKSFVKNNTIFIMLSALIALLPLMFMAVSQYFSKSDLYASSAEVNNVRAKRQVTRLVTQEYSQQNKDIENKAMRNLAMLYVVIMFNGEEKKMIMGSTLGLGGDIFVMPRHFYQRVQDMMVHYGNDNIKLELGFMGNQRYNIYAKDVKDLCVNFEHLSDVVFLQLPKICCLSKLDKFFVTTKDEPVLFGSYLFGRRVDNINVLQNIPVSNAFLTSRSYNHPELELPFLNKFLPARKIVIPEGYEFRATSGVTVGDCGMLYMNVDDKMNARKIMGIHVAGSVNGNIGLAATIYQEDVLAAYEKAGAFISMELATFESIDHSTSNLKYALKDMFNVCGVMYINDKKVKLSIPMKSSISKSAFYDLMNEDFGPNTCIPARLRPYVIDDVKYSPMLKGLAKMCKITQNIPYDIVRHICDHMYRSIMSWDSKYQSKPRLLTLDEAINGVCDLNKIDVTTSAGFPYQMYVKKGGKRDWFEFKDDKLTPTDELLEQIQMRLDMAKNNEIKATYFVDTLKDELRPIDKVLAGKTRVFQVGPMCLSILMRQYFGDFIMHCQTTFINGEMGIGINPNSYDWTLLVRRLLRIGNKFINGDYSDYDASMLQAIMMFICEVINEFYGLPYDHEDNRVRRVLIATFLNNLHIVEDIVFMRLQGNMSGIALTTIVNCLFNMFLLRYAYIKLVAYDFTHFDQHISATFYGDDNLVSVCDDIIEKMNMNTYCTIMSSLGITYTTPDKTEMSKAFYSIDEISYLKRKFYKKENIYYAQLEYATIMEIPRWSESDPNNMLDQLNRFNCVLYELVNYGHQAYVDVYKVFAKYILYAKEHGFNVNLNQLLSYTYILRSMFPQFFSCDLVNYLDQNNRMLGESGSSQSIKIGSNYSPDGSAVNSYITTMNINDNENNIQTQSAEGAIQRATVQVTRKMVAQDYSLRDLMDNIDFSVDFSKAFDFIAMSSEEVIASENIDENAGESVRRAGVTTTYDDTIPHKVEYNELPKPTEANPFPVVELPSFISREWYIGEVQWTAAYPRTALEKLFEFPNALSTYIKCKLTNIAFWAPDFNIIFKVNGTPMHYGRFMFCVIPSADIMHEAYIQPQNMSQHRFAQVSPTGNQSVILKVPWMHYYDRVNVQSSGSSIPWTLYGFPIIPLTNANADKAGMVTISIYVQITNPRFSGYTSETGYGSDGIQDLVAQSSEQVVLSKQNNVASGVTQTGIIPIANTISRTISKIAGDMSQLAVDAGFSVPPNLTATQPVIERYMYLNRAEDLPATVVLGPSQNARVIKDDNQANAVKDGMRITKVGGRMCLEAIKKITSDSAVNTVLYKLNLNPNNLYYEDFAITPQAGTVFPHPAAYLARLHKVWRGSFKLHFSFVSSAFHSLRVRFSYTPRGFLTTFTEPNAGTSAYNVNEVWDINNQTDYSVRVPWHAVSNFLGTQDTLGTICITQLTKLSSTLDTPNPIYLQVWVGMDDDFQLAYPYIPDPGAVIFGTLKMYNPDIGAWIATPEANSPEETDMITQSADRVLSSGNPLLNYREMQFPSMSSDGLDSILYPSIGGVDEKYKVCRVCTSYEIASVKELTNMLTPIERVVVKTKDAVTTATYANAGRKLIPFGWMDKGANDPVWFNFLYQIMAIYRYAKGAVRFAGVSDRATSATANLGPPTSTWDGSFWQDYTTDVFYDSGSLSEITSGSHVFTTVRDQPADITIPYTTFVKTLPQTYNIKKTGGTYPPIAYAPATTDGSILYRIPVPANTAAATEIAKIVWLVAGGDDLQLGYQIAVPRCRNTKPA